MIRQITNEEELLAAISKLPPELITRYTSLTVKELIDRLKEYVSRKNHPIFVVSDSGGMSLFAFLILPQERYAELLEVVTDSVSACREVFGMLQDEYSGFALDVVCHPDNEPLIKALQELGAGFYPVQTSLRRKYAPMSTHIHSIVPLSEEHYAEYMSIHSTDCYWTAERVIAASEVFKVFVAVEAGRVVGYVDFAVNRDESEVYDLYVSEDFRSRGIGKALMSAAIESVAPKSIFLTVDEDNAPALRMYHELGFVEVKNGRQVTASVAL